MTLTVIDNVQKCSSCGYEFSADEARVCHWCNSLICPKCGACLCAKGNSFLPTVLECIFS